MAVFYDLVFAIPCKDKVIAERKGRNAAYDIMPDSWMVHSVKSEPIAMDERAGHWKVTVTMIECK